ncbi:MAG TPA: integrase core domain-containing protein [Candidatus Nanoperiomorbaceae bacterium]|nr:integrase core domain-containing protein [Candidatus Nanoperiomorbaceae bacterium]
MAYSTNPNLPKARATALRLLVEDKLPTNVVARKCGVHRSTIYRWKQKWDTLNHNVQLTNDNRPSRSAGRSFRPDALKWNIPTMSSRPHSHAWTIPDGIVQLVLATRAALKRCAEVVWHHVTTVLGVAVSLSSVRRILRRHHCFDGARKPRVRPDNPRRPRVTAPGELVQTDTIHHVDPYTGKRIYIYTVIDLYTRLTYSRVFPRILPGLAARTVLEAREHFGFIFHMVQADNGPEFGRYFEQTLTKEGVAVRHSRLGRPNDNAHIERFNRTIQEECIGHYWRRSAPLPRLQTKIDNYTRYYNQERIHLGLGLLTPAGMLQRF